MTWTVKYIGGPCDGEVTEVGNAADYGAGDTLGDVDMSGYRLFPRPHRKPASGDPLELEGVFVWVLPASAHL